MNRKILIVDDEWGVRESLKEALRYGDYTCIAAETGKEAIEKCQQFQPHLVLLDLGLPDIHGSKVCRAIKSNRETSHIPIIVVTADETSLSELQCLRIGADDYITKPFNDEILFERIKKIFAKSKNNHKIPRVVKKGKYSLDITKREFRDGEKIYSNFAPKEFHLFTELFRKSPEPFESKYLLETIWGYNVSKTNTHTLDSHIAMLRRKLGPGIGSKIITIYGIGYKFAP